jgi:hypothetical protein
MEYNTDTKTLIISCDFNEELKDIPNDTQIIIFKNEYSIFNIKVNYLPQSLTHIIFGSLIHQKLDKLPKNLTHLTFKDYFDNKVDNLPKKFKIFENKVVLQ